jgi:hypothetical protein
MNWWLVLIILLITTPIVGFMVFLIDGIFLTRIPPEKGLLRIFKRIYRYSRWMDLYTNPGDTINKFTTRLIGHFKDYGKGSKEAEWLLYAEDILRELTRLYYLVLYSPERGVGINTQETTMMFRQLRPRLWYLWLLIRLYRIRILRFLLWDSVPIVTTAKPTQFR